MRTACVSTIQRRPTSGSSVGKGTTRSIGRSKRSLVLQSRSKHHHAGVRPRRVRSDVGEIRVEAHQGAILVSAALRHDRIGCADQSLFVNGYRVVSRPSEYQRALHGEILVDLESHHAASVVRGTTRSRANSAA